VLAVSPEGTRGKTGGWKSGFYHIATQAGGAHRPRLFGLRKELCGVGMFVIPGGNVSEDMNRIRTFYRNIRGKYPEMETEPRLRKETP
jgi:hypothetical protein